jgi:hypothetical protein
LQAAFDAVPAQAVTFFQPMRQVMLNAPAQYAERFCQQCSGSDAIDIVITEDDQQFLAALSRCQEAVHSGGHVRNQKRVRQILEPRLKKHQRIFQPT